jgi:SAM-dependent methyltransferase
MRFEWLHRDIPLLVTGGEAHVAAEDVLGDVSDGDVRERIANLEPGTEAADTALRISSYVRSHYLTKPSFITRILDALLPAVDAPVGRAVDVGCGVGGFALAIAHRYGAEVIGIETEPLALRWALAATRGPFEVPLRRSARHVDVVTVSPPGPPPAGRVRFMCADAAHPPLPAEHFDLALLINVLDSTAHPSAVLAQASALVRPGGHLLLAQPDAWSPRSTAPDHWLADGDEEWDAILAQVGLTTVAKIDDVDWTLVHSDRVRFAYRLHARLARRGDWET